MAIAVSSTCAPKNAHLSFQLIRNTTSPDEKDVGVASYIMNVPCAEVLKLGTDDNLRTYIGDVSMTRRNRVHRAIQRTIEADPKRFIVRNGGLVVTCSKADVDDAKKVISLENASVINGAQTQGEIRRHIEEFTDPENPGQESFNEFYVRIEIVVDPDNFEVIETAIARNTATPVKDITQVGGRGHLDELETSLQSKFPTLKLQKSETDVDGEDTRFLLQIVRLLMPTDVSESSFAAEKLRAYKNPAQCLNDFAAWSELKGSDPAAKRKYDFCVQMIPVAYAEYRKWIAHSAWNSQRIWEETKKGGRACRRDKSDRIVWLAPGILFPIFGALSEFVAEHADGTFALDVPAIFDEAKMIERATKLFRGHQSDPMAMGRSENAYDGLRFYTETLKDVVAGPTA
ncbi:MAG: AIPR family protein [Pseudomonadota bacterium]